MKKHQFSYCGTAFYRMIYLHVFLTTSSWPWIIDDQAYRSILGRGGPALSAVVTVVFTPTRAFHLHAPSTSARRDCPQTTNGVHSQLPARPRWLDSRRRNRPQNRPQRPFVPRFNVLCWPSPLHAPPCIAPWPERRLEFPLIGPHGQRSAYSGLAPKHGQAAPARFAPCQPARLPRQRGLLGGRLILGLGRRSDLSF